MDYSRFFVRDPAICGGELTIKGTQITVRTVLASLAEGAAEDEILGEFPALSRDAIRAVIAFAAASAQDDLRVPPVPAI